MEEEKKVAAEEVEETAAPEVESENVEHSDEKANRGPRKDRRNNNRKGGNRKGNPHQRHERKEFNERVVAINRVSKTVKGGRRIKFTALVVVGDGKGRYGFAQAKANEVPDAIKKAIEAAKKNIHTIAINKQGTISHEVYGRFGACNVFLKSAKEGTGVIAGGPVRAILELAGVRNVCSKVYGSRAPINILRATSTGLDSLHTYSEVKALRNK